MTDQNTNNDNAVVKRKRGRPCKSPTSSGLGADEEDPFADSAASSESSPARRENAPDRSAKCLRTSLAGEEDHQDDYEEDEDEVKEKSSEGHQASDAKLKPRSRKRGGKQHPVSRSERSVYARTPGPVSRKMELDTVPEKMPPTSAEDVMKMMPVTPKDIYGGENFRWWSGKDEDDLQSEDHWSGDEVAQVDHYIKNTAERPLWRIMIHIYGCFPRDLFTYGLKHKIDNQLKAAGGDEFPNLNIPPNMCKSLASLLAHPIWRADISRVRYALQVAVCYRFKDHVLPLGPFTMPRLPPRDVSKDTRDEILWFAWKHTGPGSGDWMEDLFAQLKRVVGKARLDAETEEERCLFKLEEGDVVNVINALDSMFLYGSRRWKTTAVYEEDCKQHRLKRNSHPPRTQEDFESFKKASFLADKRDCTIRYRMKHDDRPLKRHWLDIANGDRRTPSVEYLLDHRRVSLQQKEVLLGYIDVTDRPPGYSLASSILKASWQEKVNVPSGEGFELEDPMALD
ncbi:hypothetical protein SCUP234_05757 [Seiridium cupressi]